MENQPEKVSADLAKLIQLAEEQLKTLRAMRGVLNIFLILVILYEFFALVRFIFSPL